MELDGAPIERCLMLAQRLARLMRDEDSQRWLDLEQRGYPDELPPGHLGNCSRYAYRFNDGKVVTPGSLPYLETAKRAAEAVLEKTNPPTVTGMAKDFIGAGATKAVLDSINESIKLARDTFVLASTNYSRQRAMLHRWATDMLISLELGDVAEGIFEAARASVDVFIAAHAPRAAEQLVALNESMRNGEGESLSQALTSCRRLLMTIADAMFPSRAEPYKDRKGTARLVGPEQYKNRLMAYLAGTVESDGSLAILDADLAHLAARLDAVYEKACKGVHNEVDKAEAQLTVIHTYLFLAEVARHTARTP
jgi:hypothetical protein